MTTNGEEPAPSLSTVLAIHAASMADLGTANEGSSTTYLRGDRPFAVVEPDGGSFLLGRAIVAAALRTPDTRPSERGPDWIAFRPNELDTFAIDRATAWLEAAWRRAAAADDRRT